MTTTSTFLPGSTRFAMAVSIAEVPVPETAKTREPVGRVAHARQPRAQVVHHAEQDRIEMAQHGPRQRAHHARGHQRWAGAEEQSFGHEPVNRREPVNP